MGTRGAVSRSLTVATLGTYRDAKVTTFVITSVLAVGVSVVMRLIVVVVIIRVNVVLTVSVTTGILVVITELAASVAKSRHSIAVVANLVTVCGSTILRSAVLGSSLLVDSILVTSEVTSLTEAIVLGLTVAIGLSVLWLDRDVVVSNLLFDVAVGLGSSLVAISTRNRAGMSVHWSVNGGVHVAMSNIVTVAMSNVVTVAMSNIVTVAGVIAFGNLSLMSQDVLDDVLLGVAVSTVMSVSVLMGVLALLVDHAVGTHA